MSRKMMGAFKDILASVIWNTIDTFVLYIYIYILASQPTKE
jgi:hypothetical protein